MKALSGNINRGQTAQRPVVTGTMSLFRTEAEAPILATISGEFYKGNPRDEDDPDEIIDLEARDESGTVIELTESEEEEATEELLKYGPIAALRSNFRRLQNTIRRNCGPLA